MQFLAPLGLPSGDHACLNAPGTSMTSDKLSENFQNRQNFPKIYFEIPTTSMGPLKVQVVFFQAFSAYFWPFLAPLRLPNGKYACLKALGPFMRFEKLSEKFQIPKNFFKIHFQIPTTSLGPQKRKFVIFSSIFSPFLLTFS